jgi:hypothetical protein
MSELQPEYNWGSLYSQRQGHLAEVNNMTCAEALIWYHEHSYHVRPVEVTPDGNRKLALLNPGYHFAELPWPTDAEIGWLLQNWNAAWQLGMIVAWDSSYLWALDVDDLGQWERFQAEYNIIPTASQITGRDRGGMTLLYQRDPTNTEEDDRESLRQGPWSGKYRNLEVKSNGSVVVAPSVHHKTGRKYQWMADGPGYPEEASSTMLARRGDIVQAALIEVAAREKLMDRAARRRADELEQETTLADVPERPGQVLADFLADTPQEVQFEIPGLVPKQSRVIITGEEGVGKSTLSRYIGFCHAAGIHPFTAEPYGGGITVMIDCENAKSLNQMRLAELAESVGPDAAEKAHQRLVADSQIGGIDLASPWWQEYLLRMVDGWKATMLVIGPLYKLCAAHEPKSEEFFTAISLFLDKLREHDCSAWIEAHCRQASPGYVRDVVPYGNSGWRRWPEQGMHLGRSGALND